MLTLLEPGSSDVREQTPMLTDTGDPLVGLNERIDWEAFRSPLKPVYVESRQRDAGAKRIDSVLMFKVLVLQQLHNLSDERMDHQIRDRRSFMRFLALQTKDRVPDAKTVQWFRERLKELNLLDVLFAKFHEQLANHGYVARAGHMLDATFVEVPRQFRCLEENAGVKAGEPLAQCDATAARQPWMYVDDCGTKKNGKKPCVDKTLVSDNLTNKRVQSDAASEMAPHDGQVLENPLDQTHHVKDKRRAVGAGSARRSRARAVTPAADDSGRRTHKKKGRGTPGTVERQAQNPIDPNAGQARKPVLSCTYAGMMFRQCPNCGSPNVRRSSFRGSVGVISRALFSPYCCLNCTLRFRVVSKKFYCYAAVIGLAMTPPLLVYMLYLLVP
jgi:IS5 family transposase